MEKKVYLILGILLVLIFLIIDSQITGFIIDNTKYQQVAVFDGSQATNTEAFKINSNQAKIKVKINGKADTSAVIRLENAVEEFDVPDKYTLYADTNTNGKWHGEVILKNIKESWYYVSIDIPSENDWIIEVYEKI